ncbi:MAG: heme biosynthesis HemY N-terminal domain-containing protein [Pseudomonadota bacterium]
MKLGLIIVLILIASSVAANFLLADPGYVIINFRGYLIEMSVPVLALLTAALFGAIWLIRKIIIAPRRIGEAAGRYRSARSGEKMTRGMIAVAEGNFKRGERMLARSARTSDSPLFNYLAAARAAHLQGVDERRDEWLKLAYQEVPEATNAVLLTQAEFKLDRGQLEQALATLQQLDENSKGHPHALELMGRLYYQLEDWKALRELLPRLKKNSQIKPDTLTRWTLRVYLEALNGTGDPDTLTAEWKSIPKAFRKDTRLLQAYFEALMRTGQHERAEKELASAIKSEWRGPLVRLYGIVEGPDASKQLKRAENWLTSHSEDPDLLLAAARLCHRNELWGKERSYLESVIALRPTPEAYQEYGALLNQLGETDAASDAFRDGLGIVAEGSVSTIPKLEHDQQA